jgi:hypothetical protein
METRSDRAQGQIRSAADVAHAAKSSAGELAGAAKEAAATRAQGFFDQGKHAASSQIGAFANALRNASNELEGQQEPLARAARSAADTIERFSQAIEQRDLRDALDTAQDYARRQPALFFGGAFLLGLAAARFLKASAERQRFSGEQRFAGERGGSYDPSYPTTAYPSQTATTGMGSTPSY